MSREIDAKIAEHVMELEVKSTCTSRAYYTNARPYSTCIKAAFEVVEKLRDQRFQLLSNSNDSCAWFANSCGGWQLDG